MVIITWFDACTESVQQSLEKKFGKAGGSIPISPSYLFEKRMGVSMDSFYNSAHGSGRRYYILLLKFLFFFFFFFRHRISEMALPTGNLSSLDGGV